MTRSTYSGNMFRGAGDLLPTLANVGMFSVLITAVMIGVLLTVELLQRQTRIRTRVAEQPAWLRWPLYNAAIVAIILFGNFDGPQTFIYFQF